MSSSSYRKVIIIDTDDMGAAGSFSYANGVASYYYVQDIDVDEATGEVENYEGNFIYVDRETIKSFEDVAGFSLDLMDY